MELLDLPEEILIMIVKKLDLLAVKNMYDTCLRLQSVVCMHGVVKKCHMSKNGAATVTMLMTPFFRDISSSVTDLSLCGVPDLFKTKVLSALRRLRQLNTLDITYTNLHLLDFIEIHEACPTIKNIHINFAFGQPGQVTIPHSVVRQCIAVLKQMEDVHFVGSISNLLYSKLVLHLLEKAKLNTLKLSVSELDGVCTVIAEPKHRAAPVDIFDIPELNRFTIYIANWRSTSTYECITRFPVLSVVEYDKFEFFVIYMINPAAYAVYATPIFKDFFDDNFGVKVESVKDYSRNLIGNVAIMLWNKKTTTFDEPFFQELYKHVKQYFPVYYNPKREMPSLKNKDWVYTVPADPNELVRPEIAYAYTYQIKRRRIALPAFTLKYDELFEPVEEAQLSFIFNTHITKSLALSNDSVYLRKLTFISLTGQVSYTNEFFKILFFTCEKLITLNIEAPLTSPCSKNICNSIGLAKTLKNIRLLDKRIDFQTLFSSLSLCRTLENIHILDHRQWEHCDIPDPDALVQRCKKLYCVFVEAPLSEAAQTRLLKSFKKAKLKYDNHSIKVVVNQTSSPNVFKYNYHPFIEVFQLNPIKPTL